MKFFKNLKHLIPKTYQKRIILIFVIILIITITVLITSKFYFKPQKSSDNIIAKVGIRQISLNDFLPLYFSLYSQQWEMLTAFERNTLAINLLNRIVETEILLQTAKTLQISEDKKLISEINALRKLSIPKMKLQHSFMSFSFSPETWQKRIRQNVIAMKVKAFIIREHPQTVTTSEIENYYNKNQDDFYVSKSIVHLKQLVFEDYRLGKRVFRKLKKGSSFKKELQKLKKKNKQLPIIIDPGIQSYKELNQKEISLIKKTSENNFFYYQQANGEFIISKVLEKNVKGYKKLEKVISQIREIILKNKQEAVFRKWLKEQKQILNVKTFPEIVKNNLHPA